MNEMTTGCKGDIDRFYRTPVATYRQLRPPHRKIYPRHIDVKIYYLARETHSFLRQLDLNDRPSRVYALIVMKPSCTIY